MVSLFELVVFETRLLSGAFPTIFLLWEQPSGGGTWFHEEDEGLGPFVYCKIDPAKKKREKKKKMRLLLFLGKATMELAVAPLLLDELSRGELLFTMAMEPPSGVEN